MSDIMGTEMSRPGLNSDFKIPTPILFYSNPLYEAVEKCHLCDNMTLIFTCFRSL